MTIIKSLSLCPAFSAAHDTIEESYLSFIVVRDPHIFYYHLVRYVFNATWTQSDSAFAGDFSNLGKSLC